MGKGTVKGLSHYVAIFALAEALDQGPWEDDVRWDGHGRHSSGWALTLGAQRAEPGCRDGGEKARSPAPVRTFACPCYC